MRFGLVFGFPSSTYLSSETRSRMNINEIPKQYDPQDAQDRWYPFWLKNGYFHADPTQRQAAVLHRHPAAERHRGPAPGPRAEQHAPGHPDPLAADAGVRRPLDARHRPRRDRHPGGRRAAAASRKRRRPATTSAARRSSSAIWAWKDEYEARILGQLRLMGCSCDWDRTRFTLDEVCSQAVRRTFFRLFKAGKIFRGKRLVNWDTQLRTAVADDEIYYEEVKGHLWTIKYPVAGSDRRGAARRHHPPRDDARRHGRRRPPRRRPVQAPDRQEVDLPLTGRRIPIIADADPGRSRRSAPAA